MGRSWQICNVEIHLETGDLFDVAAEALVNSEQTNFVLSLLPDTISGQVWSRWGDEVQANLDQQTAGIVCDPGTVMTTRLSNGSRTIYHAGFHNPDEWLDSEDGPIEPEHVQVIGGCIWKILREMDSDGVSSVAFPLIGCGLFGLDPGILARQFINYVIQFATERTNTTLAQVFLVLPTDGLRDLVLDAFIHALIERAAPPSPFPRLNLGVPLIDQFEDQVVTSHHPVWSPWMHTRMAELVVHYMFSCLATSSRPEVHPTEIAREGFPLSFGKISEFGMKLVRDGKIESGRKSDAWLNLFATLFHDDKKARTAINALVAGRNSIAHGKAPRSVSEIRAGLQDLFGERWQSTARKAGPPPIENLGPWMVPETQNSKFPDSVLEMWASNRYRYLDPIEGRTFTVEGTPD